jgi:hypothetical protein
MPTPGLSLVGFLGRDEALAHFKNACVPPNPADSALDAEWQAAKALLGAPMAGAGNPAILPIPPQYQQYIAQVSQLAWVAPVLAQLPNSTFALVEIDPLLAFQHTISISRSTHHCAGLAQGHSIGDLLPICLPQTQVNENILVAGTANSMLLRAESLNIRTQAGGMLAPGAIGCRFGLSLPLMHVVRLNGKCYLHNGFHRALGARSAGATHIPCLFRDVSTQEEAGIRPDGATFSAALLDSADPPTLGHFTQGKAYPVQLRKLDRFIHVVWTEYAMPAE